MLLLLPVYVVYLFLFGTREMLAESLALEDLPSSDEILFQDDDSEQLDGLLIDARDSVLIDAVGKLLANAHNERLVGIVYGATHMRNVISFLLQSGYTVAKAEWVTIFDL